MGPLQLIDKLLSVWPTVMADPTTFIVGGLIGFGGGAWIVRLFMRRELSLARGRVDHLQDVIADRLPAETYRPIRFYKGRSMTIGLSLLILGLVSAVVGAVLILSNLSRHEVPVKVADQITPPIQTPTPTSVTSSPASINTPPIKVDPPIKQFTTKAPRELMAFWRNHTPLQAIKLFEPYKGLWIDIQATVLSIRPDTLPDASYGYLRDGDGIEIEVRFAPKWINNVSRVATGDQMKVRGKIGSFQQGQTFFLIECEVL